MYATTLLEVERKTDFTFQVTKGIPTFAHDSFSVHLENWL